MIQLRKEAIVKVKVNPELCQGHTLCAMAAPDVFELSDIDGHATAIDGDVPTDLEEGVHEAVRSCPEQAITIYASDSDSVSSSAAKTPERTTR